MNRRVRIAASTALLVLTVFVAHAVFAGAEDVVYDDSFSVQSDGMLKVTVDDMDVLLKVGKPDQAHVEVVLTGDLDKMTERFKKMNFSAKLQGNTLIVDTDERHSWNWGDSYHGGIHLTVTIPKQFHVYVQTSEGDVAAGGQEGGEIELKTSDGDITIDRLKAPMVHLVTSDGDIEVDDISSDDISLRSSGGDIGADLLRGKSVNLKTSDGDVEADKIEGESIEVRTSHGNLDLTVWGGLLVARTSDGEIDVTVVGKMGLDLATSDGDITIQVPPDFGAELYLEGESVELGGKVELEGEVSKHRVSGTLGDGGPKVTARTNNGSVALRID